MPDEPKHLPHPEAVKRFLVERIDLLELLQADLPAVTTLFAPRQGLRSTAQVWIAVDWSMVFEYIFAGPGLAARQHSFLQPNLERGALLAAASLLFNEINASLVLLPPYMAELQGFLDQLQAKVIDPRKSKPIIEEQLHLLKLESDELDQSVDFLLSVAKDGMVDASTTRALDEYLSSLSRDVRDRLQARVQSSFAELYLYVQVAADAEAADLLDRVLASSMEQAGLRTLSDVDRNLANQLRLAATQSGIQRIAYWKSRLKSQAVGRHSSAVDYDALAMVYLEMLNTHLHDQGKQLFFVTRDKAMERVMQEEPGSFAMLADRYAKGDATHGMYLISRPLEYWLELGRLKTNLQAPHSEDLDRVIMDEIAAAKNWLEEIGSEGTRADERAERIMRLIAEIDNSWSLFAARHPNWQEWKDAQPEDKLLRMLVRALTDSRGYEADRRRLLDRVAATMSKWSAKRTKDETDGAWNLRFGDYQKTWVAVLQKIGVERFLLEDRGSIGIDGKGVSIAEAGEGAPTEEGSSMNEVQGGVLADQLKVDGPERGSVDLKKWHEQYEGLRLRSKSEVADVRLEYLAMTVYYLEQAFIAAERLAKSLIARDAEIPVPVEVAAHLVAADCALFLSTYNVIAADDILASLLRRMHKRSAPADLNAAVLMSRMVLHLDHLDEAHGNGWTGEDVAIDTYGNQRVADALSALIEQETKWREEQDSENRLGITIDNHVIYATARLGREARQDKSRVAGRVTRVEQRYLLGGERALKQYGLEACVKVWDTLLFYYCSTYRSGRRQSDEPLSKASMAYTRLKSAPVNLLGLRAQRNVKRHMKMFEEMGQR